jgi:hypothetical protein
MRIVHLSRVAIVALIASIAAPLFSYGAAQLAAGATTSAAPTSTNPTLRQMQITFDPEVTVGGDDDEIRIPSFNVTSFQLSVKYDQQFMTVIPPVEFVGPYTQTPGGPLTELGGEGVPPPAGPATGAIIDQANGLISFIAGGAPVGNTQPGDVDIFLVNFQLKDGVSLDQILTFTIFANPVNGDFIEGTDPVSGDIAHSDAAHVIPTTIVGSFSDFTNQVNGGSSVPLPAGAGAGAFAAVLLLGVNYARRVRSAA